MRGNIWRYAAIEAENTIWFARRHTLKDKLNEPPGDPATNITANLEGNQGREVGQGPVNATRHRRFSNKLRSNSENESDVISLQGVCLVLSGHCLSIVITLITLITPHSALGGRLHRRSALASGGGASLWICYSIVSFAPSLLSGRDKARP